MDPIFVTIISILFGLVIGSFLSVCIYRIPYGREKGFGDFGQSEEERSEEEREEEGEEGEESAAKDAEEVHPEGVASPEASEIGLMSPSRSFCPECRTQLLWWHNIPLLSWFLLGGKCHFCKKVIPLRYPVVELLSAAAALLSFQLYDPATAVIVYLFTCGLIVISVIDYDYYIIPDVITFPAMGLGIVLAVVNQFWGVFDAPVVAGVLDSFWGLLAGGGFLFLVSEGYYLIRKKVGLGFGDVKLMAVVGLFFGPEAALYTIFFGSFVGALLGGLILVFLGHKMSRPLPFGPYLALGTSLYFFVGPELPQILMSGLLNLFMS